MAKREDFKNTARVLVENAPNLGRDALVDYVARQLEGFAQEQRRVGALEARETMLRSQLALHEGLAARATGDANATRNELNELLESLGKSRVWAP